MAEPLPSGLLESIELPAGASAMEALSAVAVQARKLEPLAKTVAPTLHP